MTRRLSGLVAASLIACGLGSSACAASDFPNRAIHVVVPYPAGGIVEIVARAVSEGVGRVVNQTMVVEAKPGADSNIGTAYVARSAPDGYTWLVTGPAVLVNPTLYKDAGWDATSFKCVGLAVWSPSVAIVPKALPPKTMREFVELAKSKPGELNFGNPGIGSSIDLTAKKLFHSTGLKIVDVGYKGQPPALMDLIGNLIQFEVVTTALALPHIREGTVRPLAVFTKERIPELPDVPTIAEAGFPDAVYVAWYGVFVPAATPDDVVEQIHAAIDKALAAPETQKRLAYTSIPGKPTPLADLATLMKTDHDDLMVVIKANNITAR